ncbi:MAG: superinfection immunity protein [Oscillospiraceae bacterium]|nr:superinfection immunity protein [Oscillospiraceae bacterium]
MDNFAIPLLGLILGSLYLAPTIIAFIRKHPNKIMILLVNLFLGWTIIGWGAVIGRACADIGNNKNAHPQNTVASSSLEDRLNTLIKWRDNNLISEAEYEIKKHELLRGE